MKLVVNLKLLPTPDQHTALLTTLTTANRACTWVARQAWDTQTFGQFALHKLTYTQRREQFGLAAQMAVRCIAKVADAYKLDRKTRRRFRPYAAQRSTAGIALKELTGIRARVKARRHERPRHANWGFAQLRQYVTYKARRAGVPVLLVDLRHTSQQCHHCGHIATANRRQTVL